jgi:hypothetical protein
VPSKLRFVASVPQKAEPAEAARTRESTVSGIKRATEAAAIAARIAARAARSGAPVSRLTTSLPGVAATGLGQAPRNSQSPVRPVRNAAPSRTIVTRSMYEPITEMPATEAATANIRYQEDAKCWDNALKLQREVLAALSGGYSDFEMDSRQNPTSAEIESVVHEHGPVHLKMRGLLSDTQGGGRGDYEQYHAVLVTGVVHDPQSGRRYAVLADGNDLARDPLKKVAEEHMGKVGKKHLSKLGGEDLRAVDSRIAKAAPGDSLQRSFFRVIDLDDALGNHESLKDDIGLDPDARKVKIGFAKNFAQHATVDWRIAPATKQMVIDQVRAYPETVEHPGNW